MPISRRQLLGGLAATIALPHIATGRQPPAPLVLRLPGLQLVPGRATILAAFARGKGTCQMTLLDPDARVQAESPSWSMDPDTPRARAVELKGADRGEPIRHTAQLTLTGAPAATSVSFAVTQAGPDAPGRLTDAARAARRVAFVKDPASGPGTFNVTLAMDSSIAVTIWKGTNGTGTPVYENRIENLAAGEHPVPWDLRTRAGTRAEQGQYFGQLVCTPTDSPALQPTYFASYFAVV